MEGFTQLSPGMCSIRAPLRGKHPPLLRQAAQFSAAFNHKERMSVKKDVRKGAMCSEALSYAARCLFCASATETQRRVARFDGGGREVKHGLLTCPPSYLPPVSVLCECALVRNAPGLRCTPSLFYRGLGSGRK